MSSRAAVRQTSENPHNRWRKPMAYRPYLFFAGNCREAFTRYKEIFGGELVLLTMADTPPEAGPPPEGAKPDAIMHAALTMADDLLMGADDPSGNYDGKVDGMCV